MKLNNKTGEAIICALAVFTLISVGLSSRAGNLKKNGNLIWCKMQNKGNDWCDAQYR